MATHTLTLHPRPRDFSTFLALELFHGPLNLHSSISFFKHGQTSFNKCSRLTFTDCPLPAVIKEPVSWEASALSWNSELNFPKLLQCVCVSRSLAGEITATQQTHGADLGQTSHGGGQRSTLQ